MCNIRLQASTLPWKCEVLHWFPCGAVGRSDGHTVIWVPKFIGDRWPNFLWGFLCTRFLLASFYLVPCPIFSFSLSELHFRVAFLTSTEFWFVQQSSILRYRSTSFANFSPNHFSLLLMDCNRGIWSLVSFKVPQSSFYYLLVACIVWYYASETFIGQEDMILKLWIYENHICII